MKENVMEEKNIVLKISGMTCANCELKIENDLGSQKGIQKVKASFAKGQVTIQYKDNFINLDQMKERIIQLGYEIGDENDSNKPNSNSQIIYILIMLLGGYVILNHLGVLQIFQQFPQIQNEIGYGMLFIIGVFTSLHCVAMCGGINLAQSMNASQKGESSIRSNLAYNIGRVISYTMIGGVVGAIGSVISPNGIFKGIIAILAGLFMVIMGLNMLHVAPWLKRFNLKMPKFLVRKLSHRKNGTSSFYIGLLNGLMPCGPLQAMQLYALSTGSFAQGAFSMFLFSIGTVPLMFALGAISSRLNKKFTNNMMTVCALLVVVLGIGMLNNGFALSGISFPRMVRSSQTGLGAVAVVNGNVQEVSTILDFGAYTPITVKKGIPVKWTIQVDKNKLNGCNREIIIPEYNLSHKLSEGDNLIEFTPTESGIVPFSCWMGMIRSSIVVE